MRNALLYLWALLSTWVDSFVNKLPASRGRKAISPMLTFGIVIIIIVCGVLVIYFLTFAPTTTTQYP